MTVPTSTRKQVLVVSQDPVGEEMGGNAIRAVELARALVPHADVTLAAPGNATQYGLRHVLFAAHDPRELTVYLRKADVVVSTPQSPVIAAALRRSGARLIYDLYDPTPLEVLHAHARASRARQRFWSTLALDATLDACFHGHHFLCASERQRDLWIGVLLGRRLISPEVYAHSPDLRGVIDVVPFGIPNRPPQSRDGVGIRARFPAIAADDEVVLWNGGIWNWLDPRTAVSAIALLAQRRPRAKLVFMGRPPTRVAEAHAYHQAHAHAARLGLLDRLVFFNDRWVPYADRESWILEADCGVSAHLDHLETRYAFRTRLVDCLWAGLPVVCTTGDDLAQMIVAKDLGQAVAAGDPSAMAGALELVLSNGRGHYASRLRLAADELAWPRVAQALVGFVTGPDTDPLATGPAQVLARPVQRLRATGTRAMRALLRAN